MATEMISATLEVRLKWDYRNALDLATAYDKSTLLRNTTRAFTDGTGSSQFNTVWHDRRLLTPSTGSDLLDLAGGLTDAFGNTLTFTQIKMIYIENLGVLSSGVYTPTASQDILVGGAASLDAVIELLPYDLDQEQKRIDELKQTHKGKKIFFVFDNIRFYAEEKSKDKDVRKKFEEKLIALTGKTQISFSI